VFANLFDLEIGDLLRVLLLSRQIDQTLVLLKKTFFKLRVLLNVLRMVQIAWAEDALEKMLVHFAQ